MPQVHRVVAAQVMAKWLSGRVSQKVLEQLADEVEYHQARNRQARKSHEKRTRRMLRERALQQPRAKHHRQTPLTGLVSVHHMDDVAPRIAVANRGFSRHRPDIGPVSGQRNRTLWQDGGNLLVTAAAGP